MTTGGLGNRIRHRAALAGVEVLDDVLERLVVYVDLLARWNGRVNLTAFDLSIADDAAIDRLVVEALQATPLLRPGDRRVIDLGSGGGSPAVPLAISVPDIEMTMVEVRARKGAFLREVVRTLGLDARVEVDRAEAVALRWPGAFDVVTFRAVRADRAFWRTVDALGSGGGRVLWFGGVGQTQEYGYASVSSAGSTLALERISGR